MKNTISCSSHVKTVLFHVHYSILAYMNHFLVVFTFTIFWTFRISPQGVDILLDCLCGENTGKGLSLLKPLGTYILYGEYNTFGFAVCYWEITNFAV